MAIPAPRKAHAAVLAGVVGAASLWSTSAAAQPHRTSSLSWVELPGAEGCGGAPAVARAVEERLGRHAIVSPVDAELSIEARAERSGHPPLWHAVVQLRDRAGSLLGSRELGSAADDCGELRAAVALVAALMIDPDAGFRAAKAPAPEGPPPVAPPPPPPEPLPPPPPPAPQIIVQRVEVPVPVAPGPSPWQVEPSASFALGFGVLPSTAAGVRLALAVGLPRPWAFEAFGGAWASQTAAADQGAQVRFSLVDAGVAFCPLSLGRDGRPRLSVCAGAEVGFLDSESQGFAAARSSLDPTLLVVAPGHLGLPIAKGISVRLGGELGFALVRNQFVYGDASKATHVLSGPPVVSAEADLGLSLSLF